MFGLRIGGVRDGPDLCSSCLEIDLEQQFVINTIYVAGDDDVRPGGRLRALALVTILVSLVWLYITWGSLYQWSQKTLMFGELNIAGGMMGLTPVPAAAGNQKQDDATSKSRGQDDKAKSPPPKKRETRAEVRARRAEFKRKQTEKREAAKLRKKEAQEAHVVLAATAYGWLALLSLTAFVLSSAGCAGLSSKGFLRRTGAIVLPLSIVAGAAVVWYVWKKYEWYESILPDWVRPTLVGLGFAASASIGFMLNRHGRGMHQSAGVVVIVSALLSMASVWTAVHWGQMPGDQINAVFYTKIFLVQSAYGWLMLLAVRFT